MIVKDGLKWLVKDKTGKQTLDVLNTEEEAILREERQKQVSYFKSLSDDGKFKK